MKNNERIKVGLGFTKSRVKSISLKVKDVYEAMIVNHAYDVQSEGHRAYYAIRLFKLSKDKKKNRIVNKFKKYLIEMPVDLYWGHKNQVFEVGVRLYRLGYIRKDILFGVLNRQQNHLETFDLEIYLKLGKEGLLKFIEINSKEHAKDKFSSYFPYESKNAKFLSLIKKNNVKINDLDTAGQIFVTDVEKWMRNETKLVRRFTTFDEYINFIKKNTFKGRSNSFFKTFDDEQNKYLHSLLNTATTDNEIIGLLEPIRVNGFIGDIDKMIKLSKNKNRIIRSKAVKILSGIKSSKIRKLGLKRIKKIKTIGEGVDLLSSNLKLGDDRMIFMQILRVRSMDRLHSIGYRLINCAEIGGIKYLEKSITYVFYNSTCGVCRSTLVNNYMDLNKFSKEEIHSLRYDSDKSIRKLGKKLLN